MPKILRTAIAALALAAAAQAHAFTFNLPLSGYETHTGSFMDVFNFSMPGANSGLAATLMSSNVGVYGISDFAFTITGPGGFSLGDSEPGPFAPGIAILSGLHVGALPGGAGYTLTISGNANGGSGGVYGLSLAAMQAVPVPEPGTWALIAAGLVFMAFIARRRARA